jgi:dipeptidyl aminopeptidase/acylaminoacyl peptidase
MTDEKELITTLCNLEIPNAVALSPDGKSVLYSTALTWGHRAGKHAVSILWLARTNVAGSSVKLTSGAFKDYASAWSPNASAHTFAFISDRAQAGTKWAIYLQASHEGEGNGGEAHAVTPEDNESNIESFKFSPDGKRIAFRSADEKTAEQKAKAQNGQDAHVWGEDWSYVRLRVLDLETKQIKSLALERSVYDFCWSPDGQRLAFASRGIPTLEDGLLNGAIISVVDVALDNNHQLCKIPMAADTNLAWVRDGGLHFCLGVPEDKGFCGQGIYAIDPDGSNAKYRRIAFGIDDDAASLRVVDGTILAMVHDRLEVRIMKLDGGVLYSVKKEVEAFDVYFTGKDGMVVAVATSDVNKPVEVYTTLGGSGEEVQLSDHAATVSSQDFGSCEYLACQSADGAVELDAMYLSPFSNKASEDTSKPLSGLPTIVWIHGGPNTRLTNAFNTYYYMWAPYLLSLGYAILIPNYRGSAGRGERFASYSIDGVGQYDYEDVITCTQHAIERGFADKERLIIGGWSQGGFLTFLCSVRNGLHAHDWRFQAAIAGAGISDSDSMALSSDLGCTFQPELNNGRVMWNMDRDDTRNRRASPLWEFKGAMERSKREGVMVIPPMLILHGEEDARCPVSQAAGMRRALQSEGLPFEMVTYPRQGHFFTEQKFWIDMALRISKFAEKHIGLGIKK